MYHHNKENDVNASHKSEARNQVIVSSPGTHVDDLQRQRLTAETLKPGSGAPSSIAAQAQNTSLLEKPPTLSTQISLHLPCMFSSAEIGTS